MYACIHVHMHMYIRTSSEWPEQVLAEPEIAGARRTKAWSLSTNTGPINCCSTRGFGRAFNCTCIYVDIFGCIYVRVRKRVYMYILLLGSLGEATHMHVNTVCVRVCRHIYTYCQQRIYISTACLTGHTRTHTHTNTHTYYLGAATEVLYAPTACVIHTYTYMHTRTHTHTHTFSVRQLPV